MIFDISFFLIFALIVWDRMSRLDDIMTVKIHSILQVLIFSGLMLILGGMADLRTFIMSVLILITIDRAAFYRVKEIQLAAMAEDDEEGVDS